MIQNIKYPDVHKTLNEIHPLTSEAWNSLEDLFREKCLAGNEFLIKEGQRANHCYLLIDGLVRVYFSKDGNEYNKTFFTPGTFPTPLTALISGSPSQLSYQALTDCTLIFFSFHDFRALFEKNRCLESMYLKILEREWINKERHDIRMVTNDATTNYLIFRKEYPGLEQLIPQYHIASYLGITPIQLSRIRAKLL